MTSKVSAQPCGCDPGADYHCEMYPECATGRKIAFVEGLIQRAREGHKQAYKTHEERLEEKYVPKVEPLIEPPLICNNAPTMQGFSSGATRSADKHKPDFEGFLHPGVMQAYGSYMHTHRTQRDGQLRDSDNWQRGIPKANYMKSLLRHVFDLWLLHRGYVAMNPDNGQPFTTSELCCAIMFNVMGYLKETLYPAGMNREDI